MSISLEQPTSPCKTELVRRGRVAQWQPDGVWIETEPETTCDSCTTRSLCVQRGRRRQFVTGNFAELRPGMEVDISASEPSLRHAVLLAYGIPLACCVIAAVVGQQLAPGREWFPVLGAGFGLVTGFAILRLVTQGTPPSRLSIRARPD